MFVNYISNYYLGTLIPYFAKMFKQLVFIICVFSTAFSFAKVKDTCTGINEKVEELEQLKLKITEADDTSKVRLNTLFTEKLKTLLTNHHTLTCDLSSLKSVSILTDPEKKFRIYTWPLELGGDNYDYFGFTQYKIKKRDETVVVTELQNAIFDKVIRDDKTYKADSWRGGLFYKIIAPKKRNNKYYMLLGWDGNNSRSSKKLIEVLSFSRKGEPKFGAPIIRFDPVDQKKIKFVTKYRIEFEFSSKVAMMLNYDENLEMIIFDHLSPSNKHLRSVKSTYIPDFTYDALIYKSGKWYMKRKIEARNKKSTKPKKYKPSDVGE